MLKSREPRWVAIEQRLASRGDRAGSLSATDAAQLSTQMSIAAGGQPHSGGPAKRTGPIRPGSAGSGSGRGSTAGTGTAVLDRSPQSSTNGRQPKPRKGKGKRKR
jgi:hypothetical protein